MSNERQGERPRGASFWQTTTDGVNKRRLSCRRDLCALPTCPGACRLPLAADRHPAFPKLPNKRPNRRGQAAHSSTDTVSRKSLQCFDEQTPRFYDSILTAKCCEMHWSSRSAGREYHHQSIRNEANSVFMNCVDQYNRLVNEVMASGQQSSQRIPAGHQTSHVIAILPPSASARQNKVLHCPP